MTAMIDTLKFAKNFEIAGFAKSQAEALTAAMAEMTSFAREDLVTKSDLQSAVSELRGEIALSRAEAKSDLQVAVAELRGAMHSGFAGLRTELQGGAAGSRTDLQVAVAEFRGEMHGGFAGMRNEIVSTNTSTKWQILWALFGSQFFVIAAFIALSNFSKFFN